jgi:hypothetical protein
MGIAESLETQTEAIRYADSELVFADIYQPEVMFSIWQRTLSVELQHEIDSLMAKHNRFGYRVVIGPDEVAAWLQAQWPSSHLPLFCADVQRLTTVFADLFDLSHVGVRLELVDKTMCPLFHVDKVMARMVTTYQGAVTEWLNEDNVDREALSQREPERVVLDETQIQTAVQGDVLLFKGQEWPQQQVKGVVHRSPQASPTQRRLLLTLDLV